MPRRRPPGDEFQEQIRRAEQAAAGYVQRLLNTPRGAAVLLVGLLVVVLGYGAWWVYQHKLRGPDVTVAAGPTVRVATWNLHQFSPRPPEHPQIDLRRVAEIITTNGFDVVAVQEVKKNGEEIDALLNVLGPPWKATGFSPMTGNHERFVFLYNAQHVEFVGGSARPVRGPEASSFDRTPFQADFVSGNFRFTLVTAHLFYGKDAADHEKRRQEAQALARLAADLAADLAARSGGQDVIVLGDFNEERSRPYLRCFEDQGWTRLIRDPTNLSSTEDFDNILIDRKSTREWSGTAGVVRYDEVYRYATHKQAVDEVSDHRPAYADFVTTLQPGE